jgi:hypothetical protein
VLSSSTLLPYPDSATGPQPAAKRCRICPFSASGYSRHPAGAAGLSAAAAERPITGTQRNTEFRCPGPAGGRRRCSVQSESEALSIKLSPSHESQLKLMIRHGHGHGPTRTAAGTVTPVTVQVITGKLALSRLAAAASESRCQSRSLSECHESAAAAAGT